MDYIWIAVAFISGLLVKGIKLPPLVGYLGAGFGLHWLGMHWDGVNPGEQLETLSDLGVTLLLFTIGLKLNFQSLFKTEIWAGALGHMAFIIGLTVVNSLVLGYLGLQYFTELTVGSAAFIGLAVSFCSTVCAVKVLEDRGELRARHGHVTIGILVIQDIVAVVFVALASGHMPSIWAACLLGLPLLRPLIIKLLERCGHGELLPLAGFFLALGSGTLFEALGLEAHLGALVIAVVISGDPKANELSKALLSFKDLFLIGFFLSIGFTSLPTMGMMGAALIIAIALPFKSVLFYLWLTRLKLRSRTAFLTSLSLTNYSEFGLIICAASVSYGLLDADWLVIMALAVAFSFVFSSLLNTRAHDLYGRYSALLRRFEKAKRLREDQLEHPVSARILIVGMGRVGAGAYDYFVEHAEHDVCGIEVDRDRALLHRSKHRTVVKGDGEDPDFWSHIDLTSVTLVMLAMPKYPDVLEVKKQLRLAKYTGRIACVATFNDDKDALLSAGVDVVFNFYEKAGAGFAEQSLHLVDDVKASSPTLDSR